jgi:hypothetical protein
VDSRTWLSEPLEAAAWEEEIVRRMEDLDSGRAKPDSLEEARQRLYSAIE